MNFQLRDETTGSYLLTGTSEAHPYKDMAALYDICNNLEFNYEFGRGTHWLGEEGLDYRYTNKSHIAQGWHNDLIVELTNLMRLLTIENGCNPLKMPLYNHLLINQYKPKQKLNMHRDNEPALIGPIASFTLGAPSRFTYGLDKSIREGEKIMLGHGDIMIGNRNFFNNYYHSVAAPQVSEEHPVRYNFTWRTLQESI